MLKNRNQAVVRHLSKKNMNCNRTRNCLAMIAIILTTFMFTTVFSIGFSLAKNMSILAVREQGSRSFLVLEHPTKEQIENVKKAKNLHGAGIRIHVDRLVTDNGKIISIDYYDQTEFEMNYLPAISDVMGNYPQKENEMMLSSTALRALGIDEPKENMRIALAFAGGEETFYLSGWFMDYESFSNGSHAFVSKQYIEKKRLTTEEDGLLSISAKSGKSRKLLMELTKLVSLEKEQGYESISDKLETERETRKNIAKMVALASLMILISGYLLIYNVMYISVSKDIRHYGLLKALGATPRQIRGVVRQQAARLSVVGIPIGVFLGTICSFVAVPMAANSFGGSEHPAMPNAVDFNPYIFIGTILFAAITVFLSCRKPARLAGQISPIEAMKYQDFAIEEQRMKKKKMKKNSLRGGKLYRMAWRNIFREKKRAMLVFSSLFMGMVTFLAVHVFFGCITLENYVNAYVPYDYNIRMTYDENGYDDAKAQKLIESVSEIKGITKMHVYRNTECELNRKDPIFQPYFEDAIQKIGNPKMEQVLKHYETGQAVYSALVFGIDEELLAEYNAKAYQPIDVDRFRNGEICLISCKSRADADNLLGKAFTITSMENGREIKLEIGSADADHDLYMCNYWSSLGAPEYVIVSQSLLDQLTSKPMISNVTMNCKSEAESYVTSRIKKKTEDNPVIRDIKIKSDIIQEFQSSMASMNLLTGGISVVLILIGIMNFINVMLSGVNTRRIELAMLESVGMTKKQNQIMLVFEGFYYALITSMLLLTFGSGLMHIVVQLAMKIADYAVFYYPWKLMGGMIVVVFGLCMTVPIALYHHISKESLTQRLRSIE